MSFPGGGGGENSVFVNIGGTAVPLVNALKLADEQLNMTAKNLESTGQAATTSGAKISDSTKLWLQSLKAAADQMSMTTQAMKVLAEMSSVMGSAAAESGAAWLEASSSATEYGAKLEYLAAQTKMAAESQAQLAATMGGGGGFQGFLGLNASGGTTGSGVLGMLGGLREGISAATAVIPGFVSQAASMVTGLIGFSVLNEVIQEVQGFTDSLIELNVQTEKNQFSWKYLYGGGNTPQGAAIAQQMADWTKPFSMQIPYTRQDLLNAITTLAPTGLSAQGLEHYMPTIADLAATRAPNMTLAQVAQTIMSASMGYTRMLKYDLKINPEDLIKYGLDATGRGVGIHINNPQTLLPALENYAKAKGLSGAAQDVAHQTFWGSWSSFIDRIQNFELDTGKGLFGSLKQALVDLSGWIDTHSDQISKFSDLIGNTLLGAFKGLTGIVGDFLSGVGQSGLWDFLNAIHPGLVPGSTPNAPQHSTAPVNRKGDNPKTAGQTPHQQRGTATLDSAVPLAPKPQDVNLWQTLGMWIGYAAQMLGQVWQFVTWLSNATGFTDVLKSIGDNLAIIGNAMTPEDREIIKDVFGILLVALSSPLIGLVLVLAGGLQLIVWWMQNAYPAIMNFNMALLQFIQGIPGHIGDFLGNLGKLKDQGLAKLGEFKDKIVAWAGDIKDKALTWGGDMIHNFIAGIQSKMPNLTDAMNSVGKAISNVIHHSKPEYGPLADDDQWMPDMMRQFAEGIRAGTPLVESAMSRAAGALSDAMHGLRPTGGYAPGGLAAAGAGGSGNVTLVINGSSTLETMQLIDYVLARRDAHINIASRAPGGMGLYQFGTLGGR